MNLKELELKDLSIFKKLPADIEHEIKETSILKTFSAKKIVFEKNEPLIYLYFIIKGTIHIIKDDKYGKEQLVSILRHDDFFPHIGLFEKNRRTPGMAVATEETQILLIPVTYFQDIALKNPTILMEYSKVLSKKLIELQSRLEDKAFYNIQDQIIKRLLYLADEYGMRIDEKQIQLTISLTHEELAHLVGTSRETVSRSITALKKLKALETKNGFLFLNLPQLTKGLEK